jgi:phasin family protein
MTSKKSKRQNASAIHQEAVDFVQKSIDQSQEAMKTIGAAVDETVKNAVDKTVKNIGAPLVNHPANFLDLQKKAMEFTNKNIEQAFAFGLKLFAVKEFDDALDLQQGFFKDQAESFKTQTGELNEIALRLSTEAAKPLTDSFEKSFQTFTKSFAA